MLEFNEEFKTHNSGQATTLCWCWRLTRSDGLIMGFTDHDRDLLIGEVTYIARCGFSPSELDAKLGFSIDNKSVQGILSSDQISVIDIDAGLYDGAQILCLRVNWKAPSMLAEIWRGYFGRITKSGEQFEVELTGQSARLDRSTGRVFSRMCDALFGDARCGLNRLDFPDGTTCARSYEVCAEQFSNAQNYRGFPFIIGDDAMAEGPDAASLKDGGSRYS